MGGGRWTAQWIRGEGDVVTAVPASQRRLDLHNSSVSFAVAAAGYCGFLHLGSGRICMLLARHANACHLRRPASPPVNPTRDRTVSAERSADAYGR